MEATTGTRQRRIRSPVRKPCCENNPIGAVFVLARTDEELGVVTAVDSCCVSDVRAVKIGAVVLNLLVGGREEFVTGNVLSHADHIVRVHHHRGAATTSVEHSHVIPESSRVQCCAETRWTTANDGNVVCVCHRFC
jgi:hypothetical protein